MLELLGLSLAPLIFFMTLAVLVGAVVLSIVGLGFLKALFLDICDKVNKK